MKISILGTNGFLSTAIAKYANEAGWNLDMYGLDEPTAHKFDNFYKVNLMDAELDCSGLLTSDIVVYAIGAGIQANLKEGFNLIYNLNVTAPVTICNKLKELGYKGRFVTFGSVFEMGETHEERFFTEEDVLTSTCPAPNDYTVSIGLPDGYSKNAKLYFYADGEASEISSSMVSKTFTTQTESLGYFAVIDSSISDGNNDEVTKVTLNKTSASMKKGDKLQLSATVLPQTATDKSVTWESSDITVATVDKKGVVNAISAGSAKITATAANGISAYCTITVTDSGSDEPVKDKIETKVALAAEKVAAEKEKSYFALSLSDASRIANIQLTFETSTADVKIIGDNGFTVISDISGEVNGGKYTGTAILGFLNADANLFSSDKSAEIAKITVNAENASLKITDLKVSGWDSGENVMYGTVNGINPAEATFTDALTYDVNGDGKVGLLDITEAQLYYRADKNSANWNDASKCDFNGDQKIDIEDYMAIWLNYTK